MNAPNTPVNSALGAKAYLNNRIGDIQSAWLAWKKYWHFRPMIQRETALLARERQAQEPQYADRTEFPLITVVIPTYNRGKLLVERTIPAVLNQTYPNFEIVVVGDCCTDDTGERVRQLNDPRIRFENLSQHGPEPEDPKAKWMISGSYATNRAFELARGKWIAGLDDDDVFTPDHLEVLLRFAQAHDHEIVYGILRREKAPGVWVETGRPPLASKTCANSASLYRAYVAKINYSTDSWRVKMCQDNHRTWRMAQAGVRGGFLPRIVATAPLRPGQSLPGHRAEDRPADSAPCNCEQCRQQRKTASLAGARA